MPKVLGLVSFRIYPTLMGGQKGVALFYRYLGRFAEIQLAVSEDNEEAELPVVRMLFANKQIYRNISRIQKLAALVRQQDPDLIIAEHSYTGWIAWRLHRQTGKPFIIHSHNIESKRFMQMKKWWWRFYHRYEAWIHRKAHHSFFISEDDRQFALRHFRLQPEKCSVITYGVEPKQLKTDRAALKKSLGIAEETIVLLFNGTLDYEPNYDAVITLTEIIDPLLEKRLDNYRIIITGNRAPQELLEKMEASMHIHYAGYVDDVDLYYQCADLFLNPVVNDTGVKTKLIEAIANHCTAITTVSGASGLNRQVCGNKLVMVADNDWQRFSDAIVAHHSRKQEETPGSFFQHYQWDHIAARAAATINELIHS